MKVDASADDLLNENKHKGDNKNHKHELQTQGKNHMI